MWSRPRSLDRSTERVVAPRACLSSRPDSGNKSQLGGLHETREDLSCQVALTVVLGHPGGGVRYGTPAASARVERLFARSRAGRAASCRTPSPAPAGVH